jgi:trehalose synthase
MFKTVEVQPNTLAFYKGIIPPYLYEEIGRLAKNLKGIRLLHVSSTPGRGGVAQIISREVPLLQDMGIHAEWVTPAAMPPEIYHITKRIHNGLQGNEAPLTPTEWKQFEIFNKESSRSINAKGWDAIFVQDYQPAPIIRLLKPDAKAKWLWRSHVDSPDPQESYAGRFIGYVKPCDAVIFTTKESVFTKNGPEHTYVSPVAIDPLSPKNKEMSMQEARGVVASFGIDVSRPFVTQVSRFDPWKDIPGVIRAWLMAKKEVPDLQLVLAGTLAKDDVQGHSIVKEVRSLLEGKKDAHVLVNSVTGTITKAFQTASNVVLQKSLREGFGLTVSEAMWSGTPVIGGNAGGIRIQIIHGKNGYLVNSAEECANYITKLINNPKLAAKMGKQGKEHVRKHFLLPRLVRDELKILNKLFSGSPKNQ